MAAGRYAGAGAAFALTTGRMRWAPVAAPRISHRRISNRRPLCERAGHLSTDTACPALTDRHRSVGPVATPRIAQHKTKPNHQDRYLGASGGTDQTPDGHLRSDHWHVANGCNENSAAQLVFESSMVYIGPFRRCQCQSPILAQRPSMPCCSFETKSQKFLPTGQLCYEKSFRSLGSKLAPKGKFVEAR